MHIHVGLTEWTESNFMHPSKMKLVKPFLNQLHFCVYHSVYLAKMKHSLDFVFKNAKIK